MLKADDAISFGIRAGGYGEYNFIKYLGVRIGGMYNMIPLKSTTTGSRSHILTFHTFSFPMNLKVYFFGVQNGFSWNILGIYTFQIKMNF